MSREIKYKAWLKDAKCFAEIRHISFFEGKTVVKIYDQPMSEEVWFELEDLELLQFTGLKDKNGVDIYEGDILKTDKGHIQKVEHIKETIDGTTYVSGFYAWDEEKQTWMAIDKTDEVIGNIYENKNLLEEK